jgi:hypothetical protein
MNRPTCETCDYWSEIEDGIGDCRRRSAGIYQDRFGCPQRGSLPFPQIFADKWCGEHQDFPKWQVFKKL